MGLCLSMMKISVTNGTEDEGGMAMDNPSVWNEGWAGNRHE